MSPRITGNTLAQYSNYRVFLNQRINFLISSGQIASGLVESPKFLSKMNGSDLLQFGPVPLQVVDFLDQKALLLPGKTLRIVSVFAVFEVGGQLVLAPHPALLLQFEPGRFL